MCERELVFDNDNIWYRVEYLTADTPSSVIKILSGLFPFHGRNIIDERRPTWPTETGTHLAYLRQAVVEQPATALFAHRPSLRL